MTVSFVAAKGKKELQRVEVPYDADVTFTCTEEDFAALQDGSLDLSVGFMRGQVKMAGDFGALLHYLPTTYGRPPFRV
jgi:putative sterol carrier protein